MLVLPALLALVFLYVREPSWQLLASVAAAAGAMTLIHPPHSVLVLIVLGGFLVVRALLARQDVGAIAAAIAAVAIPTAAVGVWLLPIVRDTVAHNPGAAEVHRAFANYRHELDVFGLHSYRLKPDVFGRGGAAAVAALALLPFAVFARRRLWASFVLGGMLAAFAVTLLAFVFPHLADARLDLAGPPARRLLAEGLRADRRGARPGRACCAGRCCPSRSPRGSCSSSLVPGRLRPPVRARPRRPRLADVVRVRRRGRRARSPRVFGRPPPAEVRARRAAGRGRRGAVPAPGRRPRLLPLEPAGLGAGPALAGARARARRAAAAGGGRLHRPADRLRARRLPAGLRQLDAADPQQRHEGEPPGAAASATSSASSATAARSRCRAATAPAGCSSTAPASGTRASTCRASTRMGDTFSTECDESPARDDVLPAGGRGRRAAAAEDGDAPARARDRDARARARRPEVAPPRRRPAPADAGLRPPRPLPRPARAAALRGDARALGHRPAARAGAARLPARAASRRERHLAPDGGARPRSGSSRARESTP